MERENSHKMKTRTMTKKGVGATHCKQKNKFIPLTLIKKNQNLGEITKTSVGQGLHKFVEAMVI
jgi:hypothetical protein